ncbi:MAG TPA: glycosyltransferase [Sphingomonadaceae bacterium]|nr:glycosyltransferase [Sphingomonadaceae bacterium]
MRRGHRATFLHQPDAARMVAGAGIGFHAIGADTYPPGSLDAWIGRMARLNGPVGLRGLIAETAAQTDMIAREAPGAMRALGVDAVVADQMEPGAGLAAEHLRLPFVTTATGLPINREPGVPPPYVAWDYDASERGVWKNTGGYRVSDWLMSGVGDVIEGNARRLRLPRRRRADQGFSPYAQIAQAVAGVDFPRRELPGSFHYLGPWRDADGEWTLPDPDGRPLVFCSLGSLQGSRGEIFRNVASACHELGLRLVVAHGGRLAPRDAARLPGDPLVAAYLPQRAVLAQCAVAITHAGFNTVLDALSFGVPLVAIPLAFEQPATAARLARAGVAEIVAKGAGPKALKRAVARVLAEPGYREAAGRVRADITAAGGVTRAADLVEGCL